MPEMTPEEIFNQFMEQQQAAAERAKAAPQQPVQNPTTETGLPITPQEQAVLESMKTTQTVAPAAVSSHLPTCPQCGQLHPPVKAGEKCPMAGNKIESDTGQTVNVEQYLVTLRNIAVSQIEKKGIKDPNKLFQQLTVEMTKFLEDYTE